MKEHKGCILTLEEVTVQRKDNIILENITLTIYENEIVAVVGPNGAGKTTLFKTLLGEMPYKGAIRWGTEGSLINKGKIGYVPQYLTFDQTTPLTVLELFTACLTKRPLWLKGQRAFREKVLRLLESVAIPYTIDRKIGLLSGGELQRVLLALALMPTPQLLLLDEPISGVDVDGQALFYEMVKELKEKYAMAIILISHDVDKLDTIADRTVKLNKSILAIEAERQDQLLEAKEEVGGMKNGDCLQSNDISFSI